MRGSEVPHNVAGCAGYADLFQEERTDKLGRQLHYSPVSPSIGVAVQLPPQQTPSDLRWNRSRKNGPTRQRRGRCCVARWAIRLPNACCVCRAVR